MPKFLISWGMNDHVEMADVVEAPTVEEAIRMANELAEDLWESNKIATAKPFKDKHDNDENGQHTKGLSDRPDHRALSGVHVAGNGSGDGSVT